LPITIIYSQSASKFKIIGGNIFFGTFLALKNICDPSNPQFEPALAWLDKLRQVYQESEDNWN